MMPERDAGTVFVEAAARLHFGILDPRGALGRRFGGIGAAAPAPTLLVSAQRADTFDVEGDDGDRAAEFARRFLAQSGIEDGVRVRVHRALPQHAGLGSGTQLALAVARAIADLFGISADAPALAAAVGRGRRSAVGTWIFADGGLVVERGHAADAVAGSGVAPLLARVPFPPGWRCVLAIPHCAPAVSGAAEDAALAAVPAPSDSDAERVAHLVQMALLPAIADADLARFGAALTEIQQINGRWFAPVQGGIFAAGDSERLVRCMADWGAPGVGQSSWGPAVYGIVDGEDVGVALAARVRAEVGAQGTVHEGPFRTSGARVWRG